MVVSANVAVRDYFALLAVLRAGRGQGLASRERPSGESLRRSDGPRARWRNPLSRWVVAAASVFMMAGLGSFNAWSVFRRPLSDLYGANVTDVNTAFFVSSLVFGLVASGSALLVGRVGPRAVGVAGAFVYGLGDRKSTRLNSSHANISYAVFCLKK